MHESMVVAAANSHRLVRYCRSHMIWTQPYSIEGFIHVYYYAKCLMQHIVHKNFGRVFASCAAPVETRFEITR
jgi:hypothetical protein